MRDERIGTEMKIEVQLGTAGVERVLKRYHFEAEARAALETLEKAVRPLLQARAYYCWNPAGIPAEGRMAAVLLTLGDGFDALQDLYLERQCVSEGYMLDCIGMELLMEAYEECVRRLQQECGEYASRLEFLGDRYPLELLEELMPLTGARGITYNDQYVMTPRKTVAFLVPMEEQEKPREDPAQLLHICANCTNRTCEMRQEIPATYGYQRIFGGKKS